MSLEGLRAWIGEVERKLGMRTRVFLALTVIALGGAGAAIYLAVDARESSVSESDVQALQEKLEAQIDEVATSPSPPPAEPTQPNAPAPEPEPESGKGEKGAKGGAGTNGASTDGNATDGGETATGSVDNAKLKELLDRTNGENTEAEREQVEK